MRLTALALLAFALPAYAEFVVVEETETMTVYREGDQVVVFAEARGRAAMREVAKARSPENIAASSFRSQLSGKDRIYTYYVRTRLMDGVPICEKFVTRSGEETAEQVTLWLQILALAPCGHQY